MEMSAAMPNPAKRNTSVTRIQSAAAALEPTSLLDSGEDG